MKRWIVLGLLAGLLAASPFAVAQDEDPFAGETDPFEGEDPFAEYEQQASNTSEATQSLAAEDEGEEDQAGDGDEANASTDDGETNDAAGPGLFLTAAAGLAVALATGRRHPS